MSVLQGLIYAMAFNRRKVIEKLEDLADPIAEHIAKVLLMKADLKLQRHWEDELNAWLSRIVRLRLKPSNSRVPAKLIIKELTDIALCDDPKPYTYWIPNTESQLETYSYFMSHPSELSVVYRRIITEFATESENYTFVAVQRLQSYQDALNQRSK